MREPALNGDTYYIVGTHLSLYLCGGHCANPHTQNIREQPGRAMTTTDYRLLVFMNYLTFKPNKTTNFLFRLLILR